MVTSVFIEKLIQKCDLTSEKNHLRDIILPLFDQFSMISDKYLVYARFKHLLLTQTSVTYEQLSAYGASAGFEAALANAHIDHSLKKTELAAQRWPSYFDSWLSGFCVAETHLGFYFSKTHDKCYPVACFEISQTEDNYVICAVQRFLNVSPAFSAHRKTKQRVAISYRLKVTSVACLKRVVQFFEASTLKGTGLVGYKAHQYKAWLAKLKTVNRYKSVS